jgi:acyl-[acyl-carrier-protein]-phospholipid O-acyltransferase / long-chain-fatty-acid--[acyl-carrier-protein] ligase
MSIDHKDEAEKPSWLSFWSLVVMQIQNSFTVNAVKFLIIPLGAWLAFHSSKNLLTTKTEYVLALLLVTPYLLLSPFAGWIADRFPKSSVIKIASWLQFIIVLLLLGAIFMQSLPLTLVCFFLYTIQCSLLSPAKLGIVKELVGSEKLPFATGIMEGTVVLAILAGQIISGLWFDHGMKKGVDGWNSATHIICWVTGIALIGALITMLIKRSKSQGTEPFTFSLLFRHVSDSKVVWRDRELFIAALGTAYFWGFGGFINLAVIQIARNMHLLDHGDGVGTTISKMMAVVALGIAGGSIFAGILSKRGIEWSLAPIGLIMMTLGLFSLSATSFTSIWLSIFLIVTGAGAAMFLVPLNTFLQDHPSPEKRGAVISVSNFFNNITGIGAVVLQFILAKYLSVNIQFFIIGFFTLILAILAVKKWMPELLRVIVIPIVKLLYKFTIIGKENIPQTGGILLLPNHVTWIDSFLISSACSRRVRFVMYDGFMKSPKISWFAKLFDTIPISATRAKEAVRIVTAALEKGDVVCLFAEGELTRTGCLQEIKRGFELMAHKAKCPVIPIYVDGVWGSIFSFERGEFFRKKPYSIPYGVTIGVQKPIDGNIATVNDIRFSLRQANITTMESRTKSLRLFDKQDSPTWLNGFQLGQINAIKRGVTFAMWQEDEMSQSLTSFSVGFASLYKNKIVVSEQGLRNSAIWVGGRKTRELLQTIPNLPHDSVFYDFSGDTNDLLSNMIHCHCLVIDKIVIAMSMPNPPLGAATSSTQFGMKPNSSGIILPGFTIKKNDDQFVIAGISLIREVILPKEILIDEQDFIFLPKS